MRRVSLLLTLFITLAGIYSVVVPPFETPDEIWHFAFIQHVATGQGLPVSEPETEALWRQQGVQAPGYYLAAAALTALIDQSDFPAIYERANPHRAIGQPDAPGNRNYLIHYPDQERWPWRGSIFALHLARFFSVALGAITVYAVYRTLALLLEPSWALLGAAFIAFIPQFVFISAAASNDNAINAMAALIVWRLVVICQREGERERRDEIHGVSYLGETRRTPLGREFVILGGYLGLALIAKLSALALVGLAGLTVLWVAWQRRTWRPIGEAILLIGGPLLLIAGWWYGRNWLLYGDPLAWNMWKANILLRVIPADADVILGELGSLFRSFWGLFGWMNVAYPAQIYHFFVAITLGVGLGLVIWILRQAVGWRLKGGTPSWRFWAGGLLFLWLGLLIYSWLRFMEIAPAAQGRYFFPAASTLALIFVLGLRGYGPKTLPWGWGLVAVLAALTALTPFAIIRPFYAAPPALPREPLPALAMLGAKIPQVAVVAMTAPSEPLRPGVTVTLGVTWQALASLSRDYSVFIHLIDAEGFTIAQADTMPGGGLLPTSRWRPGQLIADQYTIRVPMTAYVPNRGQWAVGLYDHRSGDRLPLLDGSDNAWRFGDVAILAPPSSFAVDLPNPTQVDFADGISLVGYKFSQRKITPGQEVTITLYWHARQPISRDYTAFVHILDSGLTMHGGHDGAPPLPTSAWFGYKEEVIVDAHTFVVSTEAPSGLYQLEIGFYPWPSFERLRLLDASGAEGADRLLLGPLRVEP
jgi:4-amino-4-deoxy-L-arabinose transferase-like glycosyltransferase